MAKRESCKNFPRGNKKSTPKFTEHISYETVYQKNKLYYTKAGIPFGHF